MQYNEEQKKDITERTEKAVKALEDLQLTVQATVQATNVGNDVFGLKVVPFLADSKYELDPKTQKFVEAVRTPFGGDDNGSEKASK